MGSAGSRPSSVCGFARLLLAASRADISGVVDLVSLSLTLIYFALWAVNARPAVDPLALLSMRMSIAHFCMLAFCWMIWRAIFFYCGLYYLAAYSVRYKAFGSRVACDGDLCSCRSAGYRLAMASRTFPPARALHLDRFVRSAR